MLLQLLKRSVLCMLPVLFVCSHWAVGQSKSKLKLTIDQAILPYDTSKSNMKFIFPTFNTQAATLSQQELAEAETLLAQCVADYNVKQDSEYTRWHDMDPNVTREDFLVNLKDYRRQFVAVTNEQHEKEVWINAFCYAVGDKWRREVVMVEDGGKCFFSVKVNLAQKKYYELRVNAP